MSIYQILSSAISGLNATQAAIRTTANNISNVVTPGYARRRTTMTSAVTAGEVTGVDVADIQRIADRYLEGAVYARGGDAGRNKSLADYYDRLQSLFGKPGASGGLPSRLTGIVKAATKMGGLSDPTEAVSAFLGEVSSTIDAIRGARDDLRAMRDETSASAAESAARVNALLTQIDGLNTDIARLGPANRESGLIDQRMAALQELSGLISVRATDQADGRVSIDTISGITLLDQRRRQIDPPEPGTGEMAIRVVGVDGKPGAATGETIASTTIGGKLGAQIEMRDRILPKAEDDLEGLFASLTETLNTVSNAGTAVPPPPSLTGRRTGLVATDTLGFSGGAAIAILKADGTVTASARLDFDALGRNASVQDMLDAINRGLGGAGTASLDTGVLTITSTDAANGVSIAQNGQRGASRAGLGFSAFFGLNDLIRSPTAPGAPIGLAGTDKHGFGRGESVGLTLRDPTGRSVGRYTLTGSRGDTVADLVAELNASPLGQAGQFGLDDRGRIRFAPRDANSGLSLSISADTTDRLGTGISFSQWSGLGNQGSGLDDAAVSPSLIENPRRLPMARANADAGVGEKAVAPGDVTGAKAFAQGLGAAIDLGRRGKANISAYLSQMVADIASGAAAASAAEKASTARLTDAMSRRDNFSGVNKDEELALLVELQKSYAASARIVTVAAEMYETLVNMVK
ncbi:FlgK family flagellar hook-associated protein [Sphingomonas morindae]|uniref:Flagellar hook-associated protein 1 n=1 Tax=Sphingomonas morindae TaxID=1541170 RepID=A0ABY4X588_9SPHN|nr:flagellar basal body rod C-terminal domain-containing protein [Sphingomonas morindae]USI72016.1 flagellar basal body protein [Sphingomonas morindae]